MVYRKIDKRKAVNRTRDKSSFIIFLALLGLFVMSFTLIIFCLASPNSDTEDVAQLDTEESASVPSAETEVEEEKEIEKIDFQPIVDEWADSMGGNKSVLIYDLDRDEVAAEYNTEEYYNTASLYKLFVVYEGYRRVQNGEWDADEKVGYTGYTMSECLDLAIRESYSPCAETLWAMIGHDELDEIIENDFEIVNSNVSVLLSNAKDVTKMMKIFYEHKDITDEDLVARMKDSFLNQPKTTYDWRQGLPSGFSDEVNVYNKVGWDYNADAGYWNIYHDTAIVEFPEKDRHFIVTVMTNKVPYQKIRDLGTMIENAFNKY